MSHNTGRPGTVTWSRHTDVNIFEKLLPDVPVSQLDRCGVQSGHWGGVSPATRHYASHSADAFSQREARRRH